MNPIQFNPKEVAAWNREPLPSKYPSIAVAYLQSEGHPTGIPSAVVNDGLLPFVLPLNQLAEFLTQNPDTTPIIGSLRGVMGALWNGSSTLRDFEPLFDAVKKKKILDISVFRLELSNSEHTNRRNIQIREPAFLPPAYVGCKTFGNLIEETIQTFAAYESIKKDLGIDEDSKRSSTGESQNYFPGSKHHHSIQIFADIGMLAVEKNGLSFDQMGRHRTISKVKAVLWELLQAFEFTKPNLRREDLGTPGFSSLDDLVETNSLLASLIEDSEATHNEGEIYPTLISEEMLEHMAFYSNLAIRTLKLTESITHLKYLCVNQNFSVVNAVIRPLGPSGLPQSIDSVSKSLWESTALKNDVSARKDHTFFSVSYPCLSSRIYSRWANESRVSFEGFPVYSSIHQKEEFREKVAHFLGWPADNIKDAVLPDDQLQTLISEIIFDSLISGDSIPAIRRSILSGTNLNFDLDEISQLQKAAKFHFEISLRPTNRITDSIYADIRTSEAALMRRNLHGHFRHCHADFQAFRHMFKAPAANILANLAFRLSVCGIDPVFLTHSEVLVEVHNDLYDYAKEIVPRVFMGVITDLLGPKIPDKVVIKEGKSWGLMSPGLPWPMPRNFETVENFKAVRIEC